ncbi:unnamed protein product [Vitrella brassicaformis CCMP3155]|uniref:Uncharacterized protein n=4 Tax=Vitrella brassicaformis TaxID=1169539 RepID=A0A0G4FQY0_VITBC|nr:unnamed protein product [Vitrella brassicaformis CCMP3155]|eukprot:CEM16864.1 unnamed protein product [Vitrella brassicaformis CCMP3155]
MSESYDASAESNNNTGTANGTSPSLHGSATVKSAALQSFIDSIAPADSFPQLVNDTCSQLSGCLRELHGKAASSFTCAAFGGSMNGFATQGSDIDVTILINPKDLQGIYPGEIPDRQMLQKRLLGDLVPVLERHSFGRIARVFAARVPILKMEHRGVEVDLSVNNALAVDNTHLLKAYCDADPHGRVAHMGRLIKKWAKSEGLVSAEGESMTSYGLILMTIFYLQVKGVLPNLQRVPEDVPADSPSIYRCRRTTRDNKSRIDVCFLTSPPTPAPAPASTDNAVKSLDELVMGFFRFYGSRFDLLKWVVSVRQGGTGSTTKRADWLGEERLKGDGQQAWVIEDPLDRSFNHASQLDRAGQAKVMSAIKEAAACSSVDEILNRIAVLRAAASKHQRKKFYIKTKLHCETPVESVIEMFRGPAKHVWHSKPRDDCIDQNNESCLPKSTFYLEFAKEADRRDALCLNHTYLDGQVVILSYCDRTDLNEQKSRSSFTITQHPVPPRAGSPTFSHASMTTIKSEVLPATATSLPYSRLCELLHRTVQKAADREAMGGTTSETYEALHLSAGREARVTGLPSPIPPDLTFTRVEDIRLTGAATATASVSSQTSPPDPYPSLIMYRSSSSSSTGDQQQQQQPVYELVLVQRQVWCLMRVDGHTTAADDELLSRLTPRGRRVIVAYCPATGSRSIMNGRLSVDGLWGRKWYHLPDDGMGTGTGRPKVFYPTSIEVSLTLRVLLLTEREGPQMKDLAIPTDACNMMDIRTALSQQLGIQTDPLSYKLLFVGRPQSSLSPSHHEPPTNSTPKCTVLSMKGGQLAIGTAFELSSASDKLRDLPTIFPLTMNYGACFPHLLVAKRFGSTAWAVMTGAKETPTQGLAIAPIRDASTGAWPSSLRWVGWDAQGGKWLTLDEWNKRGGDIDMDTQYTTMLRWGGMPPRPQRGEPIRFRLASTGETTSRRADSPSREVIIAFPDLGWLDLIVAMRYQTYKASRGGKMSSQPAASAAAAGRQPHGFPEVRDDGRYDILAVRDILRQSSPPMQAATASPLAHPSSSSATSVHTAGDGRQMGTQRDARGGLSEAAVASGSSAERPGAEDETGQQQPDTVKGTPAPAPASSHGETPASQTPLLSIPSPPQHTAATPATVVQNGFVSALQSRPASSEGSVPAPSMASRGKENGISVSETMPVNAADGPGTATKADNKDEREEEPSLKPNGETPASQTPSLGFVEQHQQQQQQPSRPVSSEDSHADGIASVPEPSVVPNSVSLAADSTVPASSEYGDGEMPLQFVSCGSVVMYHGSETAATEGSGGGGVYGAVNLHVHQHNWHLHLERGR